MASCRHISLKTKDWTRCLVLFVMLSRHLVSSAPMMTTEASPTPSVDLNVTTSGNSSEGHLEDGQSMTTTAAVDETDTAPTEEHTMQSGDGEMEVSAAEEVHLQEASLNVANGPTEVSYDSPVDDRCISAKLVEAIEGDRQLQNLAKNDSICKWNYVYDVNTRRVPELLMKAECQTPNQSPTDNETRTCEPVYFYVAVKKMDANGRWVDCQEILPVACVLANRISVESVEARPHTEGEEEYDLLGASTGPHPVASAAASPAATTPGSVQAQDPSVDDYD